MDVEGPLFITRRSVAPVYRMVLLNRKSTENLVQDLGTGVQIEVKEPYVFSSRFPSFSCVRFECVYCACLCRYIFYETKGAISGLWFHDAAEGATTAELLKK